MAEIIERLERDVLADANKYYHPMYMGHQTSAPLAVGVWMESVIGALNQSLAVWEMSPTATVIEHQIVRWLSKLAGYGAGAGGTLTSGGTEANFTAMLAARNFAVPGAWEDGVGADPPFVVYGEHAHYAVTRAIGQLGMGRRRGIPIASRDYRIDVDILATTLDRLREEGKRVMAVVATAGTTATGSFDDLETIGSLCTEQGIWLHVDGAHGASALLSARPPRALKGLSHSRSLAWDPHKMMLLPLAAGMVLTRDERDLDLAFAQQAPYLFHAGKSTRILDQGIQKLSVLAPGRRVQALVRDPALRIERTGQAVRPSLPHRAAAVRRHRGARRLRESARAGVEHPLLPLSRWRQKGARKASYRARSSGSTRSIVSCARATTRKGPAGSPRRFSTAGRFCG